MLAVCLLVPSGAHAQWTNGGANYYSTTPIGVGSSAAGSSVPLFVAMNGLGLGGNGYYNFRVGDSSASKGLLLGYDTTANIGLISTVGPGSVIAFWTHNGSAFGERVRIDGNGNVGIGKTNPSSTLDLSGRAQIVSPSDSVSAPALYANAANGTSVYADAFDGLASASGGGPGTGAFGTYGNASGTGGVGAYGYASGTGGVGVWGQTAGTATVAGYFAGNVTITGSVSKGGGSFKIDHPLDPTNKYLYHSFVESPDMMNIYNGNTLLDANGEAIVQLPEWFEALNQEFRYQLTSIGAPGPNLYIADEIRGNVFRVAGGKPGAKVSWQVTGIRHDAWANAHRIPVEEEKQDGERGYYLHPKEHGQPEALGMNWQANQKADARRKQQQ